MAELVTIRDVEEGVEGWADGAALVKDETTGKHYVVTTVQMPWMDKPETLAYETDPVGSPFSAFNEGDPHFRAGGQGMSNEDGMADLSARIDEGKLFSDEEASALAKEWHEADYDQFLKWVAESATVGAAPTQEG
jgi:hypothetical protein